MIPRSIPAHLVGYARLSQVGIDRITAIGHIRFWLFALVSTSVRTGNVQQMTRCTLVSITTSGNVT